MPRAPLKAKATLALRKREYSPLVVRGAGAEVEKSIKCLARRAAGACTLEQLEKIADVILVFPEFFTHIDGLQVFSFSQSFTTVSANFPCNTPPPLPPSHHDLQSDPPVPSTPPGFSTSSPNDPELLSPHDLIISTLLTNPPPPITHVPKHSLLTHPSLKHLTTEDIEHCIHQGHNFTCTPLSGRVRR